MKTYLDNAATTFPKPPHALEKVFQEISKSGGTPGRGIHQVAVQANDTCQIVRKKIAKFFDVLDDFRIVFTYSATDALNLAIKGFVEDGDHVLISSMEHNSVLRPLRGLEKKGVISLDIVSCDEEGYIDMDDLKRKFRNETKLVVVSHASNVTGAVQPIKEIGSEVRSRDVFLLVDAAQSAGVIPLSVTNDLVDMLVFAGHKGLYGMQGTGGLVIGERVSALRPLREGGTGFDSKSETQPLNWPEAFEAGTHNIPGIISLGEGVTFIEEIGIEKIAKLEMEHFDYIWDRLNDNDNVILYGPPPTKDRVPVLSFNIKGWEPEDIANILTQNYEISVRSGLHCAPLAHRTIGTYPEGTVRVSPGYFTTKEELRHFLQAIKNITATKVGWY